MSLLLVYNRSQPIFSFFSVAEKSNSQPKKWKSVSIFSRFTTEKRKSVPKSVLAYRWSNVSPVFRPMTVIWTRSHGRVWLSLYGGYYIKLWYESYYMTKIFRSILVASCKLMFKNTVYHCMYFGYEKQRLICEQGQ